MFIVGSDLRDDGRAPWNLVAGSDRSAGDPQCRRGRPILFRAAWHCRNRGDSGNSRPATVEVAAVTDGIRSFTTTPYVFTWTRPGARLHRHRRRTRPPIFWFASQPGADVESHSQPAAGKSVQCRGAHARRISRPQPRVLAVRYRRRRRAVRRRPARRHRRHRRSSRRRFIPAPRITSTSSPRCAPSARPAGTSTKSSSARRC